MIGAATNAIISGSPAGVGTTVPDPQTGGTRLMLPEANLFQLARIVKEPIMVEVRRRPGQTGRVVASNGYVLIRVGVDHPLADVRGYAYEHRIVASQKIGRWVRPDEVVHHINEDKQDNRPENLKVCEGNAEHFVHHRKSGKSLRLPGEPNPAIACACGCGQQLPKYDRSGRPRRFVSGHNDQPAPTMMAVLACLESGPRSVRDIRHDLGSSKHAIAVCLSKLKTRNLVESKGSGIWALRK